jgi:hypothetical protein
MKPTSFRKEGRFLLVHICLVLMSKKIYKKTLKTVA